MNTYQLINQLIQYVEEFDNSRTNNAMVSVENFTGFLNTKLANDKNSAAQHEVRFGNEESTAILNAYQLDNNIARLFVFMSRYAKSYIKKVLHNTNLASAEEFTCLAILLTHLSLTKTELMQLNLLEKTSGTEIINRLLANELAHQWDDINDKRSKRIAITEKGKELLYQVFTDMNHVGKLITGKLSLAEKFTLQYLLQQLENFHYEIHCKKSISNKEDIINWCG
ncbi:MarR family winged helix-turn-helix transcriptional regulator [Pedobacter sp. Du54]|uniref:MarR family winged helix-turn-helix transcriptional regulator n=1 Tax=Pedobacter anseongensis TaxID=3133439 RepID=UPI0030959596